MPDTSRERAPHYQVGLDLNGRLAVIVGCGHEVERKARLLVRHGADVAVICPEPTKQLLQWEAEAVLTIEQREYVQGDLLGAFLAIAMTGNHETDAAISRDADARGCLVSVPGSQSLSNFFIPSVLRRDDLQIAVSTSGKAPVEARRIKARLAEEYDEAWGPYVALLGEVRVLATKRFPGGEAEARPVFEAIADSDLLERMRAGEQVTARAVLDEFAPVGDEG